jgi:uncharacterized circularly permuted ATP-grasp superfamily protein
MTFDNYEFQEHYDEMFSGAEDIRPHYQPFKNEIGKLSDKQLQILNDSTDKAQRTLGMTFNLYDDSGDLEKVLPLDLVPRIIPGSEWHLLNTGLQQRVRALNMFLQDIYNEKDILKKGIVPEELVLNSQDYLTGCEGFTPPQGIWCHITGSDIVRDNEGKFFILEDNLRCPSGVSYMLENREIIKRAFPKLFASQGVRPVADYPGLLRQMLQYLSPKSNPVIAVLTPGIYNAAYFEHSYLAQQMGVELVSGADLIVKNDFVYMQTTSGLEQLDVIYRRIDDKFMDPLAFNPKSLLGIPGLFKAYKKGNIAIANAPGTGVADDKAVYAYVPRIIEHYLQEEAIIDNVPTYLCREEKDRKYVLDNIEQLVVKETNAAGGYGMLIGPKAEKAEHDKFRKLITDNPTNYIAQPTLSLSTVPTMASGEIGPRHVDLRPYILYGKDINVVPGALTRVALKKGSLVVNSSQGGGSKDTWVLFD